MVQRIRQRTGWKVRIQISRISNAQEQLSNISNGATLNPNSPHCRDLKELLTASYINTFYIDDAVRLELNSRTFMERVAITNETAEYLVDHLRPLVSGSAGNSSKSNGAAQSGDRIISAVYFSKGSQSMSN